mmetsp:Transcript_95774/g.243448  ORF Transcript_95774/g.243448 Transcript_95774/m.243448 type:complete len:230 (+) Transcript_95774:144-833(+)
MLRPSSFSHRRPPCLRISRVTFFLCSSGVSFGGGGSAPSSAAGGSPSSAGGSWGLFKSSTYVLVGWNSSCTRWDCMGARVMQTGLAFNPDSSDGGSTKFMVYATLEQLLIITDSLLTEPLGIEASCMLECESVTKGATPWPMHSMPNSRPHSLPVMAFTCILTFISVAASGMYDTQSWRRSPGNKVPKAPSSPPSKTAAWTPEASLSSSLMTSAGICITARKDGNLVKT